MSAEATSINAYLWIDIWLKNNSRGGTDEKLTGTELRFGKGNPTAHGRLVFLRNPNEVDKFLQRLIVLKGTELS